MDADSKTTNSPITAKMEELMKQQRHQEDLIAELYRRLEHVTLPMADVATAEPTPEVKKTDQEISEMEMKIENVAFIVRENNRKLTKMLDALRL